MDIHQYRRILYHLSLSACLLLVGSPSVPTSAVRLAPEEHSAEQAGELFDRLEVQPQPEAVESLNFSAITAGAIHTCGLTTSGGVKCWGNNTWGQLGDGTFVDRKFPVDVEGMSSGVLAVAAGGSHTCALTSGGAVKCWGLNSTGQLGDDTTTSRLTPVDVVDLEIGALAVSASEWHTCALTSENRVKCWGSNSYGQLGDGTTTDRYTPVYVKNLGREVVAVTAGGNHTCALTSSGKVKCWGANYLGQLGDGTLEDHSTPVDVFGLGSGVISIDAGNEHTCVVTVNGGVKCWGSNNLGQLGDGTQEQRTTPVDVIGMDGGIQSVTAGFIHTCALTQNSGVKCWGGNFYGQLGDKTITDRTTPVDVYGLENGVIAITAGGSHTCVLASHGQAMCWGYNENSQLGSPPIRQRNIPVDVVGLTGGVTAVTAGAAHTCALTYEGGVKCWGLNYSGQLGDGGGLIQPGPPVIERGTPVDVIGLSEGITMVSAGGIHTCGLTSEGGVKCWGSNGFGQLGDGTTFDSSSPVNVLGLDSSVTMIAAGWLHTCALTSTGNVKCWGSNEYGQLGSPYSEYSSVPVNMDNLSEIKGLAAGGYHNCVLTSDNGVKCWGDNENGQLGDGTNVKWNNYPVDVAGLTSEVAAVTAGWDHNCVLTSGGEMKCWGGNGGGQLGDGTTTNRNVPVDVIGLDTAVAGIFAGGVTCATTSSGGAKCWGGNGSGSLGNGTTSGSSTPVDVAGLSGGVSAISTGGAHSCGLLVSGRVKCWGWNNSGELGIDKVRYSNVPIMVVEMVLPSLTVNYLNGQSGSFFTITGLDFPTNTLSTLSINNQIITTTLQVNPTGSFIIFLDSSGADAGYYNVTVSADRSASTSFFLSDTAPLRPQEGGGETYTIPVGIAFHNIVYMPLIRR